jgi:cbb3-type cytochrome c oxidase subunit III
MSAPKPAEAPQKPIGTTGHEWDGIEKLNTPLPRRWLWVFYATTVWAIGYWVVYPAWPLVTSYSSGLFDWHTRSSVASQVAELQQERAPMMAKLAAASLNEIESTPELLDFARALGKRAFADNCAPCHGAGGGGAKGYPNLNDNEWLWGGSLAQIDETITHSARSGDDAGHQGAMPAFGRDGLLKPDEISTVAEFVRSVGLADDAWRRSEAWREDLCRQLRRLPRAGRQRQSRGRRAKPDRQDLALRVRQENHHGGHRRRPRRRDAGLGRQARQRHHQSACSVCAHLRRRGAVTHVPQAATL